METKTKAVALLLAALFVGGIFMTVSAYNSQPLQELQTTDARQRWFRWRLLRAAYYTLRNGVDDTVDGKLLGYRSGILGIKDGDDKIYLLCSPKFIVDGETKLIGDLKGWVGKEATIEIAKIDIIGKETKTIRVVTSITVEGVVAEAVYPNLNK
jgi:hypothetical protein